MTRRALTWGLIVSVTLNVLVVGAIAGALLTQRGGHDRRDLGGPPDLRAIARGMEADDRRALIRGLRGDPVLREGRDRLRASGAEIAEALRADPFDPAAFEAALRGRSAVQAELAAQGASSLSEIVSTMTPEARAALAERLTRRR